jgi:hypothetical protein
LISTIIIRHTSTDTDGRLESTGSITERDIALGTLTDNRSDRDRVNHSTLTRCLAGTENNARILTGLAEAGELTRTVSVRHALGNPFWWIAGDEWISIVPRMTSADCPMVLVNAVGVGEGARILEHARTHALFIYAGLGGRTVRVNDALDDVTGEVGIGSAESGFAATLSTVAFCIALRISSAGILDQTWIRALTASTGLV